MSLPQGWHDIPGYNGKYQMNTDGEIQSLYGRKPRVMKTFLDKSLGNRVTVRLWNNQDKKYKTEFVSVLMARTFLGGAREGYVIAHRDGNILNNALYNICFLTRQESASRAGKYNRKPVCKVDENGEVVKIYKSVREAAAAEYLSRKTILNGCKKRFKNPYSYDGYRFVFSDDYYK